VFTCLVAITSLGACSDGRTVAVPEVGDIVPPTFHTVPDDLSRSPQLTALVARDTAGLAPTNDRADASLLPAALAALSAGADAPTELTRLSVYDDYVYFSYEQSGINGRSVSATYRNGDDGLSVSDPVFSDEPTYPLASVDPAVPAAVVAAIEARVPNGVVSTIDLELGRSYGFGLVWNFGVDDARGTLANVFVDLDGAIIAVDES
jgi:hypothetical protein